MWPSVAPRTTIITSITNTTIIATRTNFRVRRRHADGSHHRPGPGVEICRPPAAVSPGADLRPARHRSGPIDAGGLGRPRCLAPAPAAGAAAGEAEGAPPIVCGRPRPRTKLGLISQKSKLATAIRYALSRWEGLTRFIDDGRIELDNNTVERSIRQIALSRKNALFAGSHGGAEHWATIASLIETCNLSEIDPLAYLTDVLTRIANGHPNRDIDQLLPWAYKKQELKAVA